MSRTQTNMALRLIVTFLVAAVTAASLDDVMESVSNAYSRMFSSSESMQGECQLALRVLAYEDEILGGERSFPDAGLSTFRYNIYDPSSSDPHEPIGIYLGASHTINEHDCVGTGSFGFDYNPEIDSYDSQIFVSVSCSGSFNAITGGTGRYAFIKNGHEVISDSRDIAGGSVSELHFTSET
ncbi:MAG: hypothetical protein SGILL_010661, partial [Bacillariaceae sp.]